MKWYLLENTVHGPLVVLPGQNERCAWKVLSVLLQEDIKPGFNLDLFIKEKFKSEFTVKEVGVKQKNSFFNKLKKSK